MERQEKEKNAEGVVNGLPISVPLQSAPMNDPTAVPAVPTNAQDENHSVVRAAGLIGIATFSSRILGFIRDMVLARLFGATPPPMPFSSPIGFRTYCVSCSPKARCPQPSFRSSRSIVRSKPNGCLGTRQRDLHHTADDRDGGHGARHRGGAGDRLAAGAGISRRPRQVGAHDVAHPNHVAISPLHQSRRLGHGHPEFAARFAAPAFSPVFFNIFIIGCALFLSPHCPIRSSGWPSGSWLEAQRSLRCNSRD